MCAFDLNNILTQSQCPVLPHQKQNILTSAVDTTQTGLQLHLVTVLVQLFPDSCLSLFPHDVFFYVVQFTFDLGLVPLVATLFSILCQPLDHGKFGFSLEAVSLGTTHHTLPFTPGSSNYSSLLSPCLTIIPLEGMAHRCCKSHLCTLGAFSLSQEIMHLG